MEEGGATNSVEVRDHEEVGRARHSRKPNRLAHAGTVKVSAGHCSKVPKSARHGLEYAVVVPLAAAMNSYQILLVEGL